MSAGFVWREDDALWMQHEFILTDVDWERHRRGAVVEPYYVAVCGAQVGYRSMHGRFVPLPGHPPREVQGRTVMCLGCRRMEDE